MNKPNPMWDKPKPISGIDKFEITDELSSYAAVAIVGGKSDECRALFVFGCFSEVIFKKECAWFIENLIL